MDDIIKDICIALSTELFDLGIQGAGKIVDKCSYKLKNHFENKKVIEEILKKFQWTQLFYVRI